MEEVIKDTEGPGGGFEAVEESVKRLKESLMHERHLILGTGYGGRQLRAAGWE